MLHRLNHSIALQGVLALMAFAAFLVAAAHTMQPLPNSTWNPVMEADAVQSASEPSSPIVAVPAPVTVFHGTIAKDGSTFLLRETSGSVYRLAPAAHLHVRSFVGKFVKLTGSADKNAQILHVDSIEKTAA